MSPRDRRRREKGGLGETHLAGDRLHLRLVQPLPVQDHGGRVPSEWRSRKGIDLKEAEALHVSPVGDDNVRSYRSFGRESTTPQR